MPTAPPKMSVPNPSLPQARSKESSPLYPRKLQAPLNHSMCAGDAIPIKQLLFALEPHPEADKLKHAKTQLALDQDKLSRLLKSALTKNTKVPAGLALSTNVLKRNRILKKKQKHLQ